MPKEKFAKGNVTEAMYNPSQWTWDPGTGPWQKASALERLSETRKAVTFGAESPKCRCLWYHPEMPTLQIATSFLSTTIQVEHSSNLMKSSWYWSSCRTSKESWFQEADYEPWNPPEVIDSRVPLRSGIKFFLQDHLWIMFVCICSV